MTIGYAIQLIVFIIGVCVFLKVCSICKHWIDARIAERERKEDIAWRTENLRRNQEALDRFNNERRR